MKVQVRLFNSLYRQDGRFTREIELSGETTVAELVCRLGIDARDIYVAFKNGTPLGLRWSEAASTPISDGDILALSGPVPFSWGYGAPVC